MLFFREIHHASSTEIGVVSVFVTIIKQTTHWGDWEVGNPLVLLYVIIEFARFPVHFRCSARWVLHFITSSSFRWRSRFGVVVRGCQLGDTIKTEGCYDANFIVIGSPGSAFIKPDQRNPWIKDQIKITLLPTISHLLLPNFVSCGRACPSHMTQNLVTVGAKLWTADRFIVDPWSMDYADPVW